jgi:hypothetical protein
VKGTVQSGSVRPAIRRYSSVELLIAIVVMFVAFPFLDAFQVGDLIESILFTIVMISAVFAVAQHGPITVTAALLALITLVSRWINLYWPHLLPPEVFLIGGIIFVLFVIVNLLRFVLTAASVDLEVLCASISAYLLLGLVWTFAYWLVDELVPNAFSFNAASAVDKSMKGYNSFYFSFITLSTVGYGDITPVSPVARMLAGTEAMTGLLYVAVLIARLVALHAPRKSYDK